MSKGRVSTEWVFGDIANFLEFLDFKKNLKLGPSPIGKMYIVCAWFFNEHSYLNLWLCDIQLL